MPGAGLTHGPRARKSTGKGPQAQPDHPAFPARWCYGLYVIFPGTGLSCPRRTQASSACELDTSVGVSGPHDFAVRADDARLAPSSRPSQPSLTRRDDRDTPSASRRDGATQSYFSGKRKQIFLRDGPDSRIALASRCERSSFRVRFLLHQVWSGGAFSGAIRPISTSSGESAQLVRGRRRSSPSRMRLGLAGGLKLSNTARPPPPPTRAAATRPSRPEPRQPRRRQGSR
jgi:hypothetical protein